jgi:hypothetical protein
MSARMSLACCLGLLSTLAAVPLSAQMRVSYSGTGGAETIRLRLENCSTVAATHSVWAGEVHPCVIPGHQPLVSAEDLSYDLGPGAKRTVLVPVYCGNSRVPCPRDGMVYLRPSRPYPHLRAIILDTANRGQPWRIQELIWEETDRDRLPESGPPTVLEMLIPGGRPSGPDRAPALMCRAGLPEAETPPPSRTSLQAANVRAMGWIGAFLIVPLPLALVFAATWLASAPRRRAGPGHRSHKS